MSMMAAARAAGLSCAFVLLVVCPPLCPKAHALHCAPIAGGSAVLSQADAGVRLRFIQQRLRRAAFRARIWSWGWGTTYATLAVVNLAITPAFDRNERIDYYVSAGSSAIGVATFLISPLTVMRDQRTLDDLLAHPAPATAAGRCAVLAQAEGLLLRAAKSEAFGKSLLTRLGGVIFNVGVGALLGFGFGHWGEASINMMAGVAVGQVMIATQPDDAVADLAHYRAGDLAPPVPAPAGAIALLPDLSGGHYGVRLGLSF